MRPLLMLALAGLTLGAQERPLIIEQVRVFDGQRVVQADSVLVKDGRIQALGRGLKAPEGADHVDGRGCTLMPGLIDGHVHTWGDALKQAAPFGVTTVLDMFMAPGPMKAMKQAADPTSADLRSAGYLATAPGGHGTEYGMPVPTLEKPEEAQAWVDARLAEGSDYIKIVIEHGEPYGDKPWPTLSPEIVKALATAAHARKRLAVAHISTEAEAIEALEAGVDGLVHLFEDRAPSPAFLKLVKEKKAFVVPTLSVLGSVTGTSPGAALAKDPRLAQLLTASQRATLGGAFHGSSKVDYRHAQATVRALEQAGVPVLAGTDAPNPGTAFGVSLHGELERLVDAGLSPVQALAAASSRTAGAFGLKDRGRIEVGLRADLVLVKGDPTQDILATRAIQGGGKRGAPWISPPAARRWSRRPPPRGPWRKAPWAPGWGRRAAGCRAPTG